MDRIKTFKYKEQKDKNGARYMKSEEKEIWAFTIPEFIGIVLLGIAIGIAGGFFIINLIFKI
jgi:F0F1-type ATP synthase assembly protein I